MLVVNAIDVAYDKVQVLFNLSLQVERGEILCLLGRNGAGKTTTLKSIMGLVPVRHGSILPMYHKVADCLQSLASSRTWT